MLQASRGWSPPAPAPWPARSYPYPQRGRTHEPAVQQPQKRVVGNQAAHFSSSVPVAKADLLPAFVHAARSAPMLFWCLPYRSSAAVACSGHDGTAPLDPVAGRPKR